MKFLTTLLCLILGSGNASSQTIEILSFNCNGMDLGSVPIGTWLVKVAYRVNLGSMPMLQLCSTTNGSLVATPEKVLTPNNVPENGIDTVSVYYPHPTSFSVVLSLHYENTLYAQTTDITAFAFEDPGPDPGCEIVYDTPTGISIGTKPGMTTHPSPFVDYVSFDMPGSFELCIYDLSGRVVSPPTKANDTVTVNLSHVPSGTYLAQAKTAKGGIVVSKIVK